MSYFSDDITFCPLNCDNMDCMRNSRNIRDRTIPHSYSIELPDDCPNKISFVRADWVEERIVKHEWTGNVDNISYGQILVRCKD